MSSPIRAPGPKHFYVEVCNDDDTFGIIVARFDSFDAALGEYNRLMNEPPLMRLVMRNRAHIYRKFIPERLHNSYDRSREYPM